MIRTNFLAALVVSCSISSLGFAAPPETGSPKDAAKVEDQAAAKKAAKRKGSGVTPPERISLMDEFEIDLVYEVPGEEQGSWVAMTVDDRGRLIASDQYGKLYRVDLPKSEVADSKVNVEPIEVEFKGEAFGGSQGLLYAFDALYASVNSRGAECGIFRITDTDDDDQFDHVERLIKMNGGSEHGPHALILSADGKRILHVAGNSTDLPKMDRSRVPRIWDEDHLLGRMPDARGHNSKRMAPGGFIFSMNPDGSETELIASGFRNPYDIALDGRGELFTYDADMEWDVGTPWYRPTRVNHAISGADFGWRNGTGKWPADYPDSFGAAVDIGPGSPTGISFGYGAKFPAKYQNALFIADWSYGNLHAVHLTPDGASYDGTYETFATAAPLPITDLLVHPEDGCLYMTVGGRKTQSGLYRLRYVGDESTDPVTPQIDASADESLRRRIELEAFHLTPDEGGPTPQSSDIDKIADGLDSSDRAIRHAARTALEQQGQQVVRGVFQRVESVDAAIQSVIALARIGVMDREAALSKLDGLQWDKLNERQRVDLMRAYALVALRMGGLNEAQTVASIERFSDRFPSGDDRVDQELAAWLIYLGDETATSRVVDAMVNSPSQQSQIAYAFKLRETEKGWTDEDRRRFFGWFNDIASAKGGASFGGFLANIKTIAVENLTDEQRNSLKEILEAKPTEDDSEAMPPREVVQKWTVEDLEAKLATIQSPPSFERGKSVFAAAQCYKCHRMGMQGGILGPDLTSAGGKYGQRDMLVHIVEPSKEVSDQYSATSFLTDDGRLVVGRIINMSGNKYRIMTNMLEPSSLTTVEADTIEQSRESTTSMMPAGLIDTFTAEEIADLITYLRAGGNQNHMLYREPVAALK